MTCHDMICRITADETRPDQPRQDTGETRHDKTWQGQIKMDREPPDGNSNMHNKGDEQESHCQLQHQPTPNHYYDTPQNAAHNASPA